MRISKACFWIAYTNKPEREKDRNRENILYNDNKKMKFQRSSSDLKELRHHEDTCHIFKLKEVWMLDATHMGPS